MAGLEGAAKALAKALRLRERRGYEDAELDSLTTATTTGFAGLKPPLTPDVSWLRKAPKSAARRELARLDRVRSEIADLDKQRVDLFMRVPSNGSAPVELQNAYTYRQGMTLFDPDVVRLREMLAEAERVVEPRRR